MLLSRGDGTFGSIVTYGTSGSGFNPVAADLNRDGTSDLAVVNPSGSSVSVDLGNRLSSFEGNVISGNQLNGVDIAGTSSGNIVAGNLIGPSLAGQALTGGSNGADGVALDNGTANNRIGVGSDDLNAILERNVISGNAGPGVVISLSTNNTVSGNYIGTDSTGLAQLANYEGVLLQFGATNNLIGVNPNDFLPGTERNVISGNLFGDIILGSGSTTTGNVIAGNYVGTDATGQTALGNSPNAPTIELDGVSGNTIGGTSSLEQNVISGGGQAGVEIDGNGTVAVPGTESSYSLTSDVNDSVGSNNGTFLSPSQNNAPSFVTSGGLTGLQFNGSDAYVSAGNVLNQGTNSFTIDAWVDLASLPSSTEAIVAKGLGNGGPGYGLFVSSNGEISFEISDGPVSYSQGGSVPLLADGKFHHIAGVFDASQGILFLYLDGQLNGGAFIVGPGIVGTLDNSLDFTIGAAEDTNGSPDEFFNGLINGLAVYNRALSTFEVGSIAAAKGIGKGYGNIVEGNSIGLNASGTATLANRFGVLLNDTIGNVVGGSATGAGNVISANQLYYGLFINGGQYNLVAGNTVGLAADGTTALLSNVGVYLGNGAANNIVGVSSDGSMGAGNVLSGNSGAGVVIDGADNNVVGGNLIGTDATGSTAIPNLDNGIEITSSSGNIIGGTSSTSRNVISGNSSNGVFINSNDVSAPLPGTESWYRAEGNANDSVGTNNGTLEGGATFATGEFGQAFSLNGTDAYVDMGDVLNQGDHSFTLEGWINTSGVVSQVETIASKIDPLTGTGYSLALDGGVPLIEVEVGGVGYGIGTDGSVNVHDGAFHEIAAVVDRDSNTFQIYVDGRLVQDEPISVPPISDSFDNSGDFTVGATVTSSGPTNFFPGLIDELAVYNRALTAQEISAIYAARGNGKGYGNTIEGNYIGVDTTGNTALANTDAGISVSNSIGNTIGGPSGGARNVISGNGGAGISLNTASVTLVENNYIGLSADGTRAVGNATQGVTINNGSTGTMIGTGVTGTGNVISGNGNEGVGVYDATSTGTRIQGNRIGTNADGTAPLGNAQAGVRVSSATNTTIGVDGDGVNDAGEGNLISGNGVGIFLERASNTVVAGNLIGTDISGSTALGNGTNGSGVWDGGSVNTRIGTNADGVSDTLERNVISGNAQFGLTIGGVGTANTVIAGNYIGTDVTGLLALPNGFAGLKVSDGAVNTRIGTNGDGVNDTAEGNLISGNDGDGVDVINVGTSGTVIAGNLIGTDKTGLVALPNTNDGIDVNTSGTTIGGSAPGTGNVISGNLNNGITFFDSSATGNLVAGNWIGTNYLGAATLANSGSGVVIEAGASSNVVGGTATGAGNLIAGNVVFDVAIVNYGTSNNAVEGNLIGTDATGTVSLSSNITNNLTAIFNGASNNTIGGSSPAARNIISGNPLYSGVAISDDARGNTVQGNYIGTDITGTVAIPNVDGIDVFNHASGPVASYLIENNVIEDNLISGNLSRGLIFAQTGVSNNVAIGNLIGTDVTGTLPLPNGTVGTGGLRAGVTVDLGAVNNQIGEIGEGNVIAFNDGAGVFVGKTSTDLAAQATIRGNSIYGNTALGIDLGDDGVTLNASKPRTGPNNFQDFPVLTSAYIDPTTGNLVLTGFADPGAIIDLYLTDRDPSGFGQGKTYLASFDVSSPSNLDGSFGLYGPGPVDGVVAGSENSVERFLFILPPPTGISLGTFITTTATVNGNTSEFSGNVEITGAVPTATISGLKSTIDEGTTLSLTGLGSAPNIADLLTFDWEVYKDGNPTAYESSDGATLSFAPDDAGIYTIQLSVKDNVTGGVALAGPYSVTVLSVPPTAAILNPPGGGQVGTSISIIGQGDAVGPLDRTQLQYTWTVTRNGQPYLTLGPTTFPPPNADNQLLTTLDFNPIESGLYNVTLTTSVPDDPNDTASNTAVFFVSSSVPSATIIGTHNAQGGQQNYFAGQQITLTALPDDPLEASLLNFQYSWQILLDGTSVSLPNPTGQSINFTPATSGSYQAILTVTDSLTATRGDEFVTPNTDNFFTVTNVVGPTGTITLPTNTFRAGNSYILGSTLSDPSGATTAASYSWQVYSDNGDNLTPPLGTEPTFAFKPTKSGSYVIELTVTDGDNLKSSTFQRIEVTVKSVNSSVIITNAANIPVTEAPEGSALKLTGSVSNPSSGVTYSFFWDISQGGGFPIETGTGSVLLLNATQFGTYTIVETVTGSDDSFGTLTTILVIDPPAVTINGLPATVTEGTPISVFPTFSDGTKGDTFNYTWTVMKDGLLFLTGYARNFGFTPSPYASYTVSLSVSQNRAQFASASAPLLVTHAAPSALISGDPLTATGIFNSANGTTTLTAQASSPNAADNAGLTYFWQAFPVGRTTSFATGTSSTFAFPSAPGGSYIVSLTVSDPTTEAQATSTTDTALVILGTAGPDHIVLTPAIIPPGIQVSRVVVDGLEGDDFIDASNLNVPVVLSGGLGNDTLIGSKKDSILLGGPGGDSLVGGSGNTTLIGQHGDDVMVGGSASNFFDVVPGSNLTLIQPPGNLGTDTISFGNATEGITFDMTQSAGQIQPVDASFNTVNITGLFQVLLGSNNGDHLTVGANSTLYGGNGNNKLSVIGSNSGAFGGSGSDTLSTSNANNVTLTAGTGNDTLSALGGNFITLFGGSGSGLLSAANGNDISLFGGTGSDTLSSSNSNNVTLAAGIGNDTLTSFGDHFVTLFGGTGNSSLSAANGNDISLFGGDGNDTVSASASQNVTLIGGAGNDTLTALNDQFITLFGGNGNNFLSATGTNNASVIGGTGKDTLSVANGQNVSLFGGSGNDSLSSTSSGNVTLSAGNGNDTLTAMGNDTLTSFGDNFITLFGGTGNNLLSASNGNNISLFGGSGNDTFSSNGNSNIILAGGTGNDTMTSFGDNFITLFGGNGSNSLSAANGNDISLFGGNGNETLNSSASNNVLMVGSTANDTMSGANRDLLSASGGNFITLFGGTGTDSLSAANGNDISLFGGTGNDTINSTSNTNVTINGGTGNDTISSLGDNFVTLFGGTGNNSLSAANGNDISLFGGNGNDTMASTASNNVVMVGSTSNDTMSATGGNLITLFGGMGNYLMSVSGGANNVSLFGGSGADTLSSRNSSNVTMVGGTGNDMLSSLGDHFITLFGGTGSASLYAANGNDVSLFGGSGTDTLSSISNNNVTLVGGTGNDTLSSLGDHFVTLFGGSGNSSLSASNGNNISLFGGSGNDTIASSASNNVTLVGGTGNDTLSAVGGSLILLFGGTGNDSLSAMNANDITLFGGSGSDTMGSTGGTNVTLQGGSANDTLTSSGGSNIVMLGGTGNSYLATADANLVTLFGGSGNDTLVAQSGNNVTLFGGSGVDNLQVHGGTSVGVFGGTGSDNILITGGSFVQATGGVFSNQMIVAGGDHITISGGLNNDVLAALGGTDVVVFGGGGNDTILAGRGVEPTVTIGIFPATTGSTGSTGTVQAADIGNATGTVQYTYAALGSGLPGNAISVAYVNPGTPDAPLSVSVNNYRNDPSLHPVVTVSLATDDKGNVISTAADVAAAVNAYSPARALVLASAQGSGLVSPTAAVALNMATYYGTDGNVTFIADVGANAAFFGENGNDTYTLRDFSIFLTTGNPTTEIALPTVIIAAKIHKTNTGLLNDPASAPTTTSIATEIAKSSFTQAMADASSAGGTNTLDFSTLTSPININLGITASTLPPESIAEQTVTTDPLTSNTLTMYLYGAFQNVDWHQVQRHHRRGQRR